MQGTFNKRRTDQILSPEERDIQVRTRSVSDDELLELERGHKVFDSRSPNDVERGKTVIGTFQIGPPRSTSWFIAMTAATMGGILSNLILDLAKDIHANGPWNNCFSKINTWLNDEYKMSFQVRGSGNCGTTAQTQTVYDALMDVVDKWRREQRKRACAVIDHEGGGRLEFAMSATAQPAYELECGDKLFYACKGNENGEPTCDKVDSLHDTIQ